MLILEITENHKYSETNLYFPGHYYYKDLSTKQEHTVDTANTVIHISAVHPQSLGFVSNIFYGYEGIQGFIPTKLFLILLVLRSNIIMVSSGKIVYFTHGSAGSAPF